VGFQHHYRARFERTDPSENCQRFYTLTWQPELQGGIA
jgi:hypothetical protein